MELKRSNIANFDDKSWCDHTYAIGNEFGLICIAYANNLEDALDAAVDNDKLDCMRMSDEDHAEYEREGWDDSFICLGSASEPFWSDYLWVTDITNREKES